MDFNYFAGLVEFVRNKFFLMRNQITGVILARIYTANARLFDLKDFFAYRMDCGRIGIQVRVDNS